MKTIITATLVAGAVGVALFGAGTVNANTTDAVFLRQLHSQGISGGDSALLTLGENVCTMAHEGYSNAQLVNFVYDKTNLTEYNAGYFVAMAESHCI